MGLACEAQYWNLWLSERQVPLRANVRSPLLCGPHERYEGNLDTAFVEDDPGIMTSCWQIIGSSTTLADVAAGGWRPRMADAAAPGTLIVTFYLITAIACAWALSVARIGALMAKEYRKVECRRHDRTVAYRASFLFWALLTVCMVILGVNKHLDLESWLTEFGRNIALSQGWYETRSSVQQPLVAGVAGFGLISLAVLLVLTRRLLPRHVLAFVGTVVLLCFVMARAMSFHQLDDALAVELFGVRVRWLLELGGILCIGACAAKTCWWYGLPRRLRTSARACPDRTSGVPAHVGRR
ncbi:MAG: hypothetical protein O7D91_08665 [Planctomycetota bacterium]|nr:hypothetical protein [Planctomycetota bacterium]